MHKHASAQKSWGNCSHPFLLNAAVHPTGLDVLVFLAVLSLNTVWGLIVWQHPNSNVFHHAVPLRENAAKPFYARHPLCMRVCPSNARAQMQLGQLNRSGQSTLPCRHMQRHGLGVELSTLAVFTKVVFQNCAQDPLNYIGHWQMKRGAGLTPPVGNVYQKYLLFWSTLRLHHPFSGPETLHTLACRTEYKKVLVLCQDSREPS